MQQWYQCPRCSAPVSYGAQFCNQCGQPLNWQQPQPPPQQPPQYQQPQQTPQYQQQYQQPKPPKKKSSKLGIILLGIGLLALAAVGSCVVCVMQPGSSESPTSEPTDIGQTAFVWVADDPEVLIAVDEESYEALGKAFLAKDWVGIQQLLTQNSIFSVPRNTKVLVIDSGFGKRKVRILEGEYSGQAGWITMEFLKASPN